MIIQWFNYIISRGCYVLLVSSIIVCYVYSIVQKILVKTANKNEHQEDLSTVGGPLFEEHDSESHRRNVNCSGNHEKKCQWQRNEQSIEKEIVDAKKKIPVGSAHENIERPFSVGDIQLVTSNSDFALELENLRMSNELMQRELERMKVENGRMLRQLEALRRESKISEAALKDQSSLNERLNDARQELAGLKSQLQGIKLERDAAVHMAAEHIFKTIADFNPEKIDVIEQVIDAELRRVREEEEAAEDARNVTTAGFTMECSSKTTVAFNAHNASPDGDPSSTSEENSSCCDLTFSVLARSQSFIQSISGTYVK